MTLIAGFMRDDCPILIGDILLSNNLETTIELTIPTIGKISSDNLRNGVYQPSAFSQKVNLLSPHLALAWSGNLGQAKEFMAQVIGAKIHRKPSREAIIEVFNDLEPNDLYIMGLLRDDKGMMLFDINCERIDSRDSEFEWFKAGGSGFNRLQNIVSHMNSRLISGNLNKLEYGLSSAIQISTELLSKELQTGSTLRELFGAGYEILHPIGNGLAKFADLTYYFWSIEEKMPRKWHCSIPFLAMKYSYHKDILVIRSVRLSPVASTSKENMHNIESDELHMILPIYRMVNNDELIGYTPDSLNSKYICNVFFCRNIRGDLEVFNNFGHYNNRLLPIIWNDEFSLNASASVNSKFLYETIAKISSRFDSL